MMADPTIALGFMAFVFGFHIAMVNIDMGLAVIIPIMKRIGEVKNIPFLVSESRKYMRYFAILYASAGVFGTAFTVFLLSFFPEFLWLGGIVLIIPFGLAVSFILLRLFCISTYWYTWNKLSSKYHFYLGMVLAATSFLIPLMFRTVFAFLNTPYGVESVSPLKIDVGKFFLNQTLWPLYIKSIVGAFIATLFTLVSIYAYRIRRGLGDQGKNLEMLNLYFKSGLWFLFIMPFLGFWYLASISAVSQFKFSNIAGAWFGIPAQGADYSWLFLIKLAVVTYQAFIVLYVLYFIMKSGSIDFSNKYLSYMLISLGPAAALGIVLGEYLNAFGQLPYFVAQPSLESVLPMINVFNSINPLAALFDLYVITLFALLPLLLAFFVLLYYVLYGKVR